MPRQNMTAARARSTLEAYRSRLQGQTNNTIQAGSNAVSVILSPGQALDILACLDYLLEDYDDSRKQDARVR